MTDAITGIALTEEQAQNSPTNSRPRRRPCRWNRDRHLAEMGLQAPSASPRANRRSRDCHGSRPILHGCSVSMAGDVEAATAFNRLTATVALNAPEQRQHRADEYKFDGYRISQHLGDEEAIKFMGNARDWARELKMRTPAVAEAIVSYGLDADAHTDGMDEDIFDNYAVGQVEQLKSVLSRHGDPDQRIQNAQQALKRTGSVLDILGSARHSASIGLELVLHGEALAAGRR